MSNKIYIYSTLVNAQDYVINDGAEIVTINGGANLTNKNLLTPRGTVTEVTADQYAALKANHVFALHERNGFITADDKKHDIETVADSLNADDPSRPDTVESLAKSDADVPTAAKKTRK